MVVAAALVLALVLAFAAPASAQGLEGPVEEGARERLQAPSGRGTTGTPDQVPAEPGGGIPLTWPQAPAGVAPERVFLRTETFNRRYEFVTRGGTIYGRARDSGDPWRELPVPLCSPGGWRRSRSTTTS